MPTDKIKLGGYFDKREAAIVKARAKAKRLSLANYFRVREGFKPLQPGAPNGNKNAIKKND